MHFGMVYGFSRMIATMGARVQAHVEWGHRKQSVGSNQLVSDLEPRNDRITSPGSCLGEVYPFIHIFIKSDFIPDRKMILTVVGRIGEVEFQEIQIFL
jgi:hypothetical protein